MSALTVNRAYKLGRYNIATLPASSLTAQLGSLIGFNSATGYAVLWTGAADVTFAGVCVKACVSASTVLVRCDSHTVEGYQRNDGVASTGGILVAGVTAVTDGEAAVYCGSDNLEDATLTPTAGPAIGYVERVIDASATRCHVRLLPRGYSASRGALDFILPDNVAAALDIREGSNSYMTFVTTNSGEKIAITKAIDFDLALAATGDAVNIAATMSHATQVAEALDVSIAQITNARTGGSITAIKASITSLNGSTAGVDHIAYEAACTAGDADSDHIVLKQGANFNRTLDTSAAATAEAGVLVAANVAAAWTVKEASLTFEILKTTTATPGIDWTFALTGAEQALHLTTTANLASGAISGFTSQIATVTTNHTAGVIAAFKASVTSLAGDTGGDFCAMHIVSVDGGGSTPVHSGIYCDDPLDAFLKVAATGDGSVVVGAMTAKSPENDAEAGYFSVLVGGTRYEVPMYAVA